MTPKQNRPFGIPRCRWDNNIKTDLQKRIGWGRGLDYLAKDRDNFRTLVNAVMNL